MVMRTRALLALAIFAALLSFLKFSPCQSTNWATPDQYIHACYSDLPSLFGERGMVDNKWPYASDTNSVEYPVLTGLVMYATSFVAHSPISYFNFNAFLLALLFIGVVFIVYRIKPEFTYLLPLAPAMIASLYINWDLWAITTMMLAIYWFDRKAYLYSSLALAISISTKFLPVFLLLPILFILWRSNQIRELVKYALTTAVLWLAINLPFALTTPTGWWRFYKLNVEREADWGSLWLAFNHLGLGLANLNYLTILLLLIGLTSFVVFLFELKNTPTLASVAFIVLAIVMVASKVYSPQYVLWLTPLAVIALTNKKDLHAFWIWQSAETLYHLAIWQHLALFTGAKFGLQQGGYATITLIRIGATIYLAWVLIKRALEARNTQGSLFDLLFEGSKPYP
ncbi:MAG: mannosyltransferase [Actinobacteria bacterium]|nr:mannosyltransferase [Actinomycetota bacterium]NCX52891.1 mannosyltransferase [Actinomycetota bacterium]